MIAALTTLMFLTVLWMIGVVGAGIAAESGQRITAAVGGLPRRVSPRQGRRAAA